jgi:hypothetical protein
LKKLLWILIMFLIGFFTFWFPSFIGHALAGKEQFSKPIFFLIFICPFLTSLIFLYLFRKKYVQKKVWVAPLFVMGIWILGPLGFFVDGSFSGGGFTSMESPKELFVMILCFPITTFSGSTYDGTLGALLCITLVASIQFFWDILNFFKKLMGAKLK